MFSEGQKQTIEAVLANRDARVDKQTQLMDEYPRRTIVAVKLNIPGPIKNNPSIKRLFDTGMTRILHLFANRNIPVKVADTWDKPTGNELFLVANATPEMTKQATVCFEDKDGLGRLFDADVLDSGDQMPISRTKFGFPVRRCFICNRIAKDCARSRRHSVLELQAKVAQIAESEIN